MRVNVQGFGLSREVTDLPDHATVGDVKSSLSGIPGDFEAKVRGSSVTDSYCVSDGDTVTLTPKQVKHG